MKFPISKFTLDRTFTKEERKIFVNCVRNTNDIEDNIGDNVGNAKSKNMAILDIPDLINIKSFCLSSLNNYTNDPDIYITESWLNFTMPGEWHHSHNHPNSLISGVFYVNAVRSVHTIVFSELEEIVNVGKCDLLLFPSYLLHHVPQNPGNELRISLAFNTSKPTT
jgi:hypothetical protein